MKTLTLSYKQIEKLYAISQDTSAVRFLLTQSDYTDVCSVTLTKVSYRGSPDPQTPVKDYTKSL